MERERPTGFLVIFGMGRNNSRDNCNSVFTTRVVLVAWRRGYVTGVTDGAAPPPAIGDSGGGEVNRGDPQTGLLPGYPKGFLIRHGGGPCG